MIGDLIGEWIKGILIDGIMGNLSGLFNTVNTKVGEIASDVGATPQDWNGGIFSMLQSLHEIKSFIENNLLKDFKSIGLTHEKFFYGFFTLEQSLL